MTQFIWLTELLRIIHEDFALNSRQINLSKDSNVLHEYLFDYCIINKGGK